MVRRLALLAALFLPACDPNGYAVDDVFCDPDEACFAAQGTGVWCGGSECPANACFVGWYCNENDQCAATAASEGFNDGNLCTIEECDPEVGWSHRVPSAKEIDDGDKCTLDECDPAQGITHTNTCT